MSNSKVNKNTRRVTFRRDEYLSTTHATSSSSIMHSYTVCNSLHVRSQKMISRWRLEIHKQSIQNSSNRYYIPLVNFWSLDLFINSFLIMVKMFLPPFKLSLSNSSSEITAFSFITSNNSVKPQFFVENDTLSFSKHETVYFFTLLGIVARNSRRQQFLLLSNLFTCDERSA